MSIPSTIAAWSETLFKSKRNTSMKRSIINKSSLNSPEINIKRQLLHTKTFVQDQPTCKVEFQLCLCLSLILVADIPLRWRRRGKETSARSHFYLIRDDEEVAVHCSLFIEMPWQSVCPQHQSTHAALPIMDIMQHKCHGKTSPGPPMRRRQAH